MPARAPKTAARRNVDELVVLAVIISGLPVTLAPAPVQGFWLIAVLIAVPAAPRLAGDPSDHPPRRKRPGRAHHGNERDDDDGPGTPADYPW
jgi:hypothetical protein